MTKMDPNKMMAQLGQMQAQMEKAQEELKTAYVERPLERGPGGAPENSAGQRFDWVASDFIDLAAKLGA